MTLTWLDFSIRSSHKSSPKIYIHIGVLRTSVLVSNLKLNGKWQIKTSKYDHRANLRRNKTRFWNSWIRDGQVESIFHLNQVKSSNLWLYLRTVENNLTWLDLEIYLKRNDSTWLDLRFSKNDFDLTWVKKSLTCPSLEWIIERSSRDSFNFNSWSILFTVIFMHNTVSIKKPLHHNILVPRIDFARKF